MTKKSTTKKEQEKNKNYTANIIGIILALFGIFGITQKLTGPFGIFLANIARFLVGDLFIVLDGLLVILGGYLFIKGKLPTIGFKKACGGILIFVGFMQLFSAVIFSIKHIDHKFIGITINNVLNAITHGSVKNEAFSGLIGSLIYTASYRIFSLIGTCIIAIVFLIWGFMLVEEIPIQKLISMFGLLGKYFYNLFDHSTEEKEHDNPKRENTTVVNQKEPEFEQKNDIDPFAEAASDAKQEKRKPVESQPVKEHESEETFFQNYQSKEYPDYIMPTVDELKPTKAVKGGLTQEELTEKENIIVDTFKDFNIDVQVTGASVGSSVTQIEIEPPHGVKISRILGLSDNLALALANKDIRIEAPIAGKSRIGIEVPNAKSSPVYFRDVWSEFSKTKDEKNILEVPLGRDINGDVISMNLVKMPHLLIAGSTGSGKSVSINEILISILMMARPDQVQMILVDPKKVELNVYNDIPHLLTPVVTDPKKAAGALNQAVVEMERRYELFKQTGSRNINEYNKNLLKDDEEKEFLPYILIVIDELSDLMMVAGSEVEQAVIRLAQLARAAGIHMIIATQRPSVDVITGLIKANIPSRIAFAVSSGVDSRTILDTNGAEKLIGHGDMLFDPMGSSSPTRVQGAFIATEDVESVTDFVKRQGDPEYDDKFDVSIDDLTESTEVDGSEDQLFDEAVDLIYDKSTASSSMLQRYFKIGYNRAASLIDDMERYGMVGPMNGSKGREVYQTKIDAYRYQKSGHQEQATLEQVKEEPDSMEEDFKQQSNLNNDEND
ncbi:FtsK/SpoIIIE family DNA translocase [Xylocopilactobacillus apis]|uniref:DNA translocase FtsK n=1 Tax=Xylocopilactobacillus apis TaxID=2932183 RepID=A0AAU9CZ92_9LACO|nr:DNA translocase FtsK [Xylocopilactobacillus apis]BDR56739.1 DNA translocase FtsK [Xylocopilactobacillus apis]